MKSSLFKKTGLAFLLLFSALSFAARAQMNAEHFIYIQAKNKQPFYVIMDNTLYSSSTIGYLIIPKLKSGTYNLKIGFPKQMENEQNYICVINNEDLGYSLQQNDSGDWGLLDLQSQTFLATTSGADVAANAAQNPPPAETPAAPAQNNNSASGNTPTAAAATFGDMLSSVADDSTLKEQPISRRQQQRAPADDNAIAVAPEQTNNFAAGNSQNTNSSVEETYGIIKTNENNTGNGQQMTFVLFNSRSTDTVQILIPVKTPQQPVAPRDTNAVQSNTNVQPANTLPLFGNDGNVSSSANAGVQSVLAQCDNPLTDKEMLKLQKKIIGKTTDDEMLSVVDKTISGKCITTEQVRQLGTSFLSDAGRFALYQDAYGNVADKNNYPSLQNQLLDTYFKKRFTDMLNQPK